MQMPSYAKFLKDILANKRKLEDHMTVSLTENCPSLVQNKIPPKLKDPGSFSIPCMIGDVVFHKALCDLGASINFMPLSMFRKLGLGEPKPTRMSLQLADRSVKYPRGVIEDVLVKVDRFIFPADFVVLDMEEDMEMPLILGRPFLATGKALIDVQEWKLRLRVGEEEITFDVFNALKHTLHSDSCYRINAFDAFVSNYVQAALRDPLEATLNTEMREDELDAEKAKIVAYLNANQPWKRPIRMRLEDLGDLRDLLPQKSSLEEPPTLELKPLPPHLKYIYLGENNTLPVIIFAALTDVMEDKLLEVLKAHKSAFAWKVADIKGINPSVCMHKILMEDKYSPLVQPQRRLNPKMQENLKVVLMRCEETNLVLNWEKCHFMVQEGIVLGHKISGHGMEVEKAKVEVIKNLPSPASIKGVRSFLGHAGFYRRFIKDFSKIAKPLSSLLMKDVSFDFNSDCLQAYENLKERLVTAPVLVAPDWDLFLEVMCDASDTAVGALLGQRQNKVFHTIYYIGKTLDEAQLNYATTEKELLALVFVLDKFHAYLVLSKVIIYIDHSALKYLLAKKDAKPRLLLLQEFDLEIKDKKGVENVVADHLSRLELVSNDCVDRAINDWFLDEQLFEMKHCPWYANFDNFLVTGTPPPNLSFHQRKKFFSDVKYYFWEEPYLFKICADAMIRRCVAEEEFGQILNHCHDREVGGHFGPTRTASKVLECGFYWPTLFKDARSYVLACDKCQRTCAIYNRHEMPLNNIIECEVFDVWGIDFMGPFPSSFTKKYILVAVDYVSKWVETEAYATNDAQLEHRPYWATKALNFNFTDAGERRLLQLDQLEEFRNLEYNLALSYKEKTKKAHDKRIIEREFKEGDNVLFYNSRLRLFPEKLKSRWSGPFVISKVYPSGAVELHDGKDGTFTVNAQRLKHYMGTILSLRIPQASRSDFSRQDFFRSSLKLPVTPEAAGHRCSPLTAAIDFR
ncbi:uncharacterized protein [Primulina huaijiensis]|uniref:uncharacterized protein n=1 Tax=Primulina huaijiensis TaxID=1492673 RepID=UPI003CC71E36